MSDTNLDHQETVTEDAIRAILSGVLDPEVGENIIDLGLIYGVEIQTHQVKINLTMTSAACPMGEMLLENIHDALVRDLPPTYDFEMHLVWEPPWEPEMMSAAAKQRLGWH